MAKAKIKRLYLIPILSKALDVIELLEQNHTSLTLEDVYQKTRISKTSVYRILKTLVHRGYVAQSQNGQYRLVSRPRRLRFGFAVQSADMPFPQAVAQSITAAAASAGVELIVLDNKYDADVAIQNAEELVAKRVDIVLEFQVEEAVAPRIAHIFKKADIPLIAIDVPHPNATYFGVDNFEAGYEVGIMLAKAAQTRWKGKVDRVIGVGFSEAGSFVQSRISGAFDALRARMPEIPAASFEQVDGRGMREHSRNVMRGILTNHRAGDRILVVAATDSSALGVLDAAREANCEADFGIAGQDCIEEVMDELRKPISGMVGTISHDVETYGPRLIQLGIALLRGNIVPPYNYVRHRAITSETLAEDQPANGLPQLEGVVLETEIG